MNEFMARQIIFMMLLLGTAPSFAKSKNSSAPNSPPNVESEWRKVKELQLHFENLESSAANARLIKGAAFLAATGYLWGVYIAEEKVLTGDFLEVSRGVVGVTGGLFALGGILTMILPGEAESAALEYRKLPSRTVGQLKEKALIGEARLRRLAQKAKYSRSIVGGGFMAVGAADVLWYLGTGSNTNFNFLPYLGGLYLGFGALLVLLDSPEEYEYKQFKENQEQRRREWNLSVIPQNGGLAMGFSLRF